MEMNVLEELISKEMPENSVQGTDYDPWMGSVILYFRELKQIRILSKKQEEALMQRIENGDESAREELLLGYLKLVPGAVHHCYKSHSLCEENDLSFFLDMVQEANLSLMFLARKYNPGCGICFRSAAIAVITNAIRSAFWKEENEFRKKEQSTEELALQEMTESRY